MNPLQLAWWRQAFAIPAAPSWDSETAGGRQLDWLARQVVELGLAVPAVMLLESARPLQGSASRLVPFFEPFWTTWAGDATAGGSPEWVCLLEQPAAIDWLIRRIEELGTPHADTPAAAVSSAPLSPPRAEAGSA